MTNVTDIRANFVMKKLIGILMCVLCVVMIAGCSSKPSVDNDTIRADVLSFLKNEYEDIDNFEETPDIQKEKLNDSDESKINEKYENIDVEKFSVSFVASSLSKKIEGKCSIIYGYIDEKWTSVLVYDVDSDSWTFTAKEVRPSTGILDDLGETQFEKFELGYIGRNDNTRLTIKSRKTDLENGTDKVDATIAVTTNFSKYTIGIKLDYVFEKGKWLLKKTVVDDFSTWKVEYIDANVPKAIDPENVYAQLTNQSYFLTYCINNDFVTKHEIVKDKENTDATSIAFLYTAKVYYENLGVLTYKITIPYEWKEQWVSKEAEIKIVDMDISEIKNCEWSAKGAKLVVENLESSTGNTYQGQDIIVAKVSEQKADNSVVNRNMKFQVSPTKKDSEWNVVVFEEKNGTYSETEIQCKIDLKTKSIVCGPYVFSGKKKEIKVEEETSPFEDLSKTTEERKADKETQPTTKKN